MPLVGRVAAGEPLLAQQQLKVIIRSILPCSSRMLISCSCQRDVDERYRHYGWRFAGSHKTQDVRNGQVVVARIDDEVPLSA